MPEHANITDTLLGIDGLVASLDLDNKLLDILMDILDDGLIIFLQPDQDIVHALHLILVLFVLTHMLLLQDAEKLVVVYADYMIVVL